LLRAAGALVLEARAAEPQRPQPAGDGSTGDAAAPGGHRAYRHRPSGARAFSVSQEGDAFRVSGQQIEREAGMTDMESDDAVARLQRRLRRIGVDEALAAAGCSQGDTVRIGALEFEYVDDARVGG
jgi:Obg family GTPase CgtA-like protein